MQSLSPRTRRGYQRLPRTIFITIVASVFFVTVAGQVIRMRARQAGYQQLAVKYFGLAERYTSRSESDETMAGFFAEDLPNLENLARTAAIDGDAEEVAASQKMVSDRRSKVDKLRADSRQWTKVSEYYASLQKQYEYAAEHPWWPIPAPSGDPLDVESVFLVDSALAER